MRILRMEIPMTFTMEFLQAAVQQVVAANGLEKTSARIRLSVFRNDGGLYLPKTNQTSYIIEAQPLEQSFYSVSDENYEIELFKDFYLAADLLSTLKTSSKTINVVGSIYASENGYQNCLLLNASKQVVEALNGNLFLVEGTTLKTPPISDGCLNGIIRKKTT